MGLLLAGLSFIRLPLVPKKTDDAPLSVLQKHPVLGLVGGTTSYVPSFFPIWGNQNTFSWEPFFERTLAPNQSTSWWIDYDF